MTKIVIIDPFDEMVIHSVTVSNKESKKNIDRFYQAQITARGHTLERILIRGGTLEIMDPGQEIPVPPEEPAPRRIQ